MRQPADEPNRQPPSDQGASFDGRRFQNAGAIIRRGLYYQLKWLLTRKRKPWPVPTLSTPAVSIPSLSPDQTALVTFIGHASFLIQTHGMNLLVDPVFSERVSPVRWVGPRRYLPPALRLEDLPRIDVVLISHNHYDHCDKHTLRWLQAKYDSSFITSRGNKSWFARKGIIKVTEMDWWQQVDLSPRIQLTHTPAQHFSMRLFVDRDVTLWGGFCLSIDSKRILFLGDSGYCGHFKEIRERLGATDLALIPIGAYEPRWFMKEMHMNPEEAVLTHLDLESARTVAMHFGTFHISDEGMEDPVTALQQALAEKGVSPDKFIVPGHGQTFVCDA